MIQVGEVIVSFDVIEKKFSCDLSCCKGICCIEGDAGAPLTDIEIQKIKDNFLAIKSYMKPQGIVAVEQQGFSVTDIEGDTVTPLINNCECAYSIQENGSCWCAIEKAYMEGKTSFRKPESCFLYPIRIVKLGKYDALNYHQWSICNCAMKKGEKEGIPVYKFLKQPLIDKYGEAWYEELELVAKEYLRYIASKNKRKE